MKKRILSVLLALALCLGLAVPAFAADSGAAVSGTCGKSTVWSFDRATGTLTIGGTGAISWDGDMRREIIYPWKDFKQEIRAVIIEEGVTSIGTWAFKDCAGLTQVSIPRSVTGVGIAAFSGTPWLENQGEFAIINGILIQYQGSAEKVAIPGDVTSVNDLAFARNSALTEVVIPEGVTSLGQEAFDGCKNLAQVTFPSTLREVSASCFSGTEWLENQRAAGDFILAGPVLLKYQGKGGSVAIPDGVAYVETAAFTWSTWFPFAEDLELDALIVPASMRSLNAELAFFTSIPKHVIYKGSRGQWDGVENTAWYDGIQVPVYFADGKDPAYVFTDVPEWCAAPVDWAVEQQITDGKGNHKFAPDDKCKHGEILTFLWRAAGKPDSGAEAPIPVTGDEWYAGALHWAAGKGMIGEGFELDAPCTRADAVNYIWQAFDKPDAEAGGFTDVPADASCAEAVGWAVANGLTNGYGNNAFRPGNTCSRGEIVTFLHRAYVPGARLR